MQKSIRMLFVVCFLLIETQSYAQWIQTTGPGGGNISTILVSGSYIFAGTRGGGIFRSTNNGTNWTAVNSGLLNRVVLSLEKSGGNIFAGTIDGIFRSTDYGTSWTAADSGISNIEILSLAAIGTTLFAGTGGSGVYRSENSGSKLDCG